MRSQPAETISVIIPVHNNEAYLAEAVTSVLGQSHPALDVIVVNDGSTDGTGAVAGKFAGRIRYVSQANGGIGAARNRGLEMAGAPFLAFLDSDDRMMPDALSKLYGMLRARPELDLIFAHVREFLSPELTAAEAAAVRPPFTEIPGRSPATMLIRREAFFRIGEFSTDRKQAESLDWYSRAVHKGLRHDTLPEVLWERRLHAGNNSRTLDYRTTLPGILKETLDRNRRQPTS